MIKLNIIIKITLVFTIALSQLQCFSRFHYDPEVDQNETLPAQIFPEDLLIGSPTSTAYYVSTGESVTETTSDEVALETERLLEAETLEDCTTTLELPAKSNISTACYGPNMKYENHFDLDGANSGTLPGGDLGIWLETEPGTNEACASRVLNAKLDSINTQINFSRQSLASLVCVLRNDNELSLPADGETLDLTDALADSVNSDLVTLSSATLSVTNVDDLPEYSYSLNFTVKPDADALANEVVIDMQHHLLNDSGSEYEGSILYQYNQLSEGGNCPGRNTFAGSLHFENINNTQKFRSDSAEYCKMNDSPFTNSILDPTYTYDGLHVGGWGNQYNIFIGNFDLQNQSGNFSYSWQAGPGDGYSRVFNIATHKVNGEVVGDAYFGYGQDVTDGDSASEILGFICDWATPNGTRTLQNLVQSQTMHLSDTTFVSDDVSILFAPTQTCNYNPADETDATFFNYDIDANQVLDATDQDAVDMGIVNELIDINNMTATPPQDPTQQ